jgi:hypothetical protein
MKRFHAFFLVTLIAFTATATNGESPRDWLQDPGTMLTFIGPVDGTQNAIDDDPATSWHTDASAVGTSGNVNYAHSNLTIIAKFADPISIQEIDFKFRTHSETQGTSNQGRAETAQLSYQLSTNPDWQIVWQETPYDFSREGDDAQGSHTFDDDIVLTNLPLVGVISFKAAILASAYSNFANDIDGHSYTSADIFKLGVIGVPEPTTAVLAAIALVGMLGGSCIRRLQCRTS